MPEFITSFFEAILYQPIFNIFVVLYNVVPDVGIVVFVLTIAIKLLLYPLTKKSIKSQQAMKDIQPKLQKIKEEYDDQQKVAQKTMELYSKKDVSPFGSCLPILIQIPIFIALYWVLRDGVGTSQFNLLYSFVSAPAEINPISLGYVNLANSGNWILAGLAAASQYWQTQSMQSGGGLGVAKTDEDSSDDDSDGDSNKSMQQEMMSSMGNMMKFMPIITFFIGLQLPAGVALYWFLSTFTTAAQHKLLRSNSDGEDGGDQKDDDKSDESKQSESSTEDEEVIEGEVVD
mgnify:CR=1 FL=1